MNKTSFSIDGCKDKYTGYTDGSNWNGWENPWLPKAEAERFTALFDDPEMDIFYWEGDELFLIAMEYCGDGWNDHLFTKWLVPRKKINGEICYFFGNRYVWNGA